MNNVQKGVSERYPCRKGRIPYRPTRPVQALLTLEAAAFVQVVIEPLALSIRTIEEV